VGCSALYPLYGYRYHLSGYPHWIALEEIAERIAEKNRHGRRCNPFRQILCVSDVVSGEKRRNGHSPAVVDPEAEQFLKELRDLSVKPAVLRTAPVQLEAAQNLQIQIAADPVPQGPAVAGLLVQENIAAGA